MCRAAAASEMSAAQCLKSWMRVCCALLLLEPRADLWQQIVSLLVRSLQDSEVLATVFLGRQAPGSAGCIAAAE